MRQSATFGLSAGFADSSLLIGHPPVDGELSLLEALVRDLRLFGLHEGDGQRFGLDIVELLVVRQPVGRVVQRALVRRRLGGEGEVDQHEDGEPDLVRDVPAPRRLHGARRALQGQLHVLRPDDNSEGYEARQPDKDTGQATGKEVAEVAAGRRVRKVDVPDYERRLEKGEEARNNEEKGHECSEPLRIRKGQR